VPDDDVIITPYRDGPLLVRGPFKLQDQDGNEIDVGRRTVALCRCGKSRIRPFCDGTHKVIRFRAPSTLEDGRAQPAQSGRFTRDDAADETGD
jgi:CDGSH-type Zn-finger protein